MEKEIVVSPLIYVVAGQRAVEIAAVVMNDFERFRNHGVGQHGKDGIGGDSIGCRPGLIGKMAENRIIQRQRMPASTGTGQASARTRAGKPNGLSTDSGLAIEHMCDRTA